MEPMTLGSPTHSPSNSPSTNYLPPFLMGEFHQPITPRTGGLSPTKTRPLAFGNSSTPRSLTQQSIPQYSTPIQQKTVLSNNVSYSNKSNGPPTQGLFDTIHQSERNNKQSQSPTTPFTSPTSPKNFYTSQENIFNQNDSQNISMMNQQILKNPPYSVNHSIISNNSYANLENSTIGNEENEYWVTIFGFPSSTTSMILTQFSNCGNIVEKKFPTQGNWVCLRFSSRSDVIRALALNGRVLSGGIMIGVFPYSHPNNENTQINRNGVRQLAIGPSRIQNDTALSPNTSSNSGAQRSSGAISRALEYMFGW